LRGTVAETEKVDSLKARILKAAETIVDKGTVRLKVVTRCFTSGPIHILTGTVYPTIEAFCVVVYCGDMC
jgi:hypothetical protein